MARGIVLADGRNAFMDMIRFVGVPGEISGGVRGRGAPVRCIVWTSPAREPPFVTNGSGASRIAGNPSRSRLARSLLLTVWYAILPIMKARDTSLEEQRDAQRRSAPRDPRHGSGAVAGRPGPPLLAPLRPGATARAA